jgi:methanogenic corrinoid protein MtbC1
MASELMTAAEIHDFGIEVVFNYLKKEGHEIVSVNTNVGVNPQVLAKKNGQLEFIVVRTACYLFSAETLALVTEGQVSREKTPFTKWLPR